MRRFLPLAFFLFCNSTSLASSDLDLGAQIGNFRVSRTADASEDESFFYGAQASLWIQDWLGVGANYNRTSFESGSGAFSVVDRWDMIEGDVKIRFLKGTVRPYIRAGLGQAYETVTLHITGAESVSTGHENLESLGGGLFVTASGNLGFGLDSGYTQVANRYGLMFSIFAFYTL